MKNESFIQLNERIQITPFLVPHRDDYSETVGFKIQTKSRGSIFIQILINGKFGIKI